MEKKKESYKSQESINDDLENKDEIISPAKQQFYQKIGQKVNTHQEIRKTPLLKSIVNRNRGVLKAKSFIELLNSGQAIDYNKFKEQLEEVNKQDLDSHRQYIEKADLVKKVSNTSTMAFSIKPQKQKLIKEGDQDEALKSLAITKNTSVVSKNK